MVDGNLFIFFPPVTRRCRDIEAVMYYELDFADSRVDVYMVNDSSYLLYSIFHFIDIAKINFFFFFFLNLNFALGDHTLVMGRQHIKFELCDSKFACHKEIRDIRY